MKTSPCGLRSSFALIVDHGPGVKVSAGLGETVARKSLMFAPPEPIEPLVPLPASLGSLR